MVNRTEPPKMVIVDLSCNEESNSRDTIDQSPGKSYANFAFQHIKHCKGENILSTAMTSTNSRPLSEGAPYEENIVKTKSLCLPWLLPQGRPLAAAPPLVKAKPGTVVNSQEAFISRKRKNISRGVVHKHQKAICLTSRALPRNVKKILAEISTC
mmetsp:Transcript_27487/g.41602  ORF Transcript_27487/g.41602 Transcript_27487/m.41602 type:complete len:155 (-) Transcript_27487:187-651(-)